MTREEEEIKKKFKFNLKNSIHDLTRAIDDVDLGYCKSDYEDSHYWIFQALKDIRKAILLYERDCDWIDLD